MPLRASFPPLTTTPIVSILMFLQISLISSTTNSAPMPSLRRKDMQIVNILQSTFMNTSNVLFLLDDNKARTRTSFSSSTSTVIIELAIKLFSYQKSFQICALNNFVDLFHLLQTRASSFRKEKWKKKRRKKHSNYKTHWRRQYIERESLQLGLESEKKLEHENYGRTYRNKQGNDFAYHKRESNRISSGQVLATNTLSSGNSNSKQINFSLSAMTSIVIMLKNANALNSLRSFPINIPSLAKVIFLYDECMIEGEDRVKGQMLEFSRNFWLKFRILFTSFASFCQSTRAEDIQNFDSTVSSERDSSALRENNVDERVTSTIIRNRLQNDGNRNSLEHSNFALIQSLYIYNPFVPSGNSRIPSETKHKFPGVSGIEKIDLGKDIATIESRLRRASGTGVIDAQGQTLRVVGFTTPNMIQKSDFPFLARHLSAELLRDPFKSLDAFVGIEVQMIRELARKMNFTIELVPVTDRNAYGWKLPNGTFVGALGDMVYKRADICLNGFFVKDYETKQLLFTTSIQDDKICIAVTTPALIPRSLLLFKVFTMSMWLLVITTFLIASVLYTSLLCIVNENNLLKAANWSVCTPPPLLLDAGAAKVRSPKSDKHKRHKGHRPSQLKRKRQLPFKSSNRLYNRIATIVTQCCRIIAVLLNASVSHSFNSSSYERVFVVLCLLLGLNLTGSFQGSLMDVYTSPREYPSIDTLEQLDRTGMLIILEHAGLQTDIFGTESPGSILGNLRTKIKVTGVADDILLRQIGLGEKFAALLRLGDLDRIKFKIPYRSDGKTLIHVIPDCPKTYNLAFLVHKSSDLYGMINPFLGLIAASGIIDKWIRDSVYMFRLHGYLKYRKLLRDSKLILTLSHLQLAFFTLLVGYLAANVLFVAEIIWERKRLKQRGRLFIK